MSTATETVKSTDLPHIGIVIIGHVDAGKSTTTGHLLLKQGGISQREVDKMETLAKEQGKTGFGFAYVTDNNPSERERGITINCNAKRFFTDNYYYTIIDAPGHNDFVKNMMSGAAQADVAFLLVPATGFEEAIAKGGSGKREGQTRQHADLVNIFGVKQIIVGVNKMDAVKYSEERFNEIRDEMLRMLEDVGYKKPKDRVPIIPMSGFQGENLTVPSTNMPWYKGWDVATGPKTRTKGVTVLDALNDFVKQPKRNTEAALRMPIGGIYSGIKGVGTVIAGRVEQGTLETGTEVVFNPSGCTAKLNSIEMHNEAHARATPGDNVGMSFRGLDKKTNFPAKGDILMPKSDPQANKIVQEFTATVRVYKREGIIKAANDEGKGGYTPIATVCTAAAPCKVTKLLTRCGKKTTHGAEIENPTEISYGDTAKIVFQPQKRMYVEPYKSCERLGRVAVMDGKRVVMVGMINSVVYADRK